MRVFMTGGETRDLQIASYTAASGSWTMACDTTSALGTNSAAGYRAYTATVGATTGSAKVFHSLGMTPRFFNANEGGGGMGSYLGSGTSFWRRFYFNVNTIPASGTYTHRVYSVGTSNGTNGLTARLWDMFIVTGGVCKITSLGDPAGAATLFTPTVGTTYRMEVEFVCTLAGATASNWTINTKVYAQTGTTALAQLSQPGGGSFVATTVQAFEFGCVPVAFGRGPFDIRFDDDAVNNNVTSTGGSGVHNGSPLGGSCYREQDFDNGSTGTYKEWTATGGGDVADVEAGAAYAAYDDTDYIRSTNALPMRHSFILPNYGPPVTANTIKTLCVLVRHGDDTGTPGNDFFHKSGLYDGTNIHGQRMEASSVAGQRPTYMIVDEKYGGGALDSTYYNGSEVIVQRDANLVGLNLVRVSYIFLEVEDDDGVSFTPPTFTPGKTRAQVI